MRVIVYGDIHGCLEEFKQLREKLRITKRDKEFAVGDTINKGPFSLETLQYLRLNDIELVIGNHEDKYITYHKTQDKTILNEKQQQFYKSLSQKDINYLLDSPYFVKLHNTLIVHAGVTDDIELSHFDDSKYELLTTLRYVKTEIEDWGVEGERFWSREYKGSHGTVIYGHTVFNDIYLQENSIGIDTGCVYGNKLTALIITNTKDPLNNYSIEQVPALKKYA